MLAVNGQRHNGPTAPTIWSQSNQLDHNQLGIDQYKFAQHPLYVRNPHRDNKTPVEFPAQITNWIAERVGKPEEVGTIPLKMHFWQHDMKDRKYIPWVILSENSAVPANSPTLSTYSIFGLKL